MFRLYIISWFVEREREREREREDKIRDVRNITSK